MPTRPTTPAQKEDAQRLRVIYKAWLDASPVRRTQDDVAEAIGSSQSAVAQTLTGRLALNAPRAAKFAKLLGCTVGDFSPALAAQISIISGGESAAPRGNSALALAAGTRATLGESAMAMARAVHSLSEGRRKTIARLVASQIAAGPSADDAKMIDDLSADALVCSLDSSATSWRSVAMGLAETHPKLKEREQLTRFVTLVDRFIRERDTTNQAAAPSSTERVLQQT